MKPLKIQVAVAVFLGALAGAAAWAAPARPVAVSPGHPGASPVIADRCPTFNWGSVEGARAYELVVVRLPEDQEAAEPEPLIRVTLPGSAHGWTPALERCLVRGGRYAWSLRARRDDGLGEWSEASFFRVAAAPSAAEVEQALAVLQAYLAAGGQTEGFVDRPAAKAEARQPSPSPAVGGPQPRLPISPDATALTGELPDPTGVGFGLRGISHSAGDGSAGVVGEGRATSGEVFGVVGQVTSAAGAAGAFDNTAGGDVLRGLNDGTEVFRVDGTGQVTATGFTGDGSGLSNVAAASADDLDCPSCVSESELDFDPATQGELDSQTHAGEDVTSGTVGESFVDAAIARDSEILPTVLAGDGSGSTLDADLLDGNDASAFLPAGADAWVDESGDTMTGTLVLNPAAGNALETSADIVLNGDVHRGGTLFLHADGNDNTALGDSALLNSTIGGGNTAIGAYALYTNSAGTYNSALGPEALYSNTVGNYNTAVGGAALKHSVDGDANTALGYAVLYSNASGSRNTGVGSGALYAGTTGLDNVAVGYHALDQTAAGSANVAIGSYAGSAIVAGDDNVLIASPGEAGDSGTIRVGDPANQTRAFIAGISNTTMSGDPVVVDAYGRLGVASGGIGDADTLDGLDSTELLRSNAGDSFTSGTLTTAAGTTLDIDGSFDATGATSTALPAAGISGAGAGSGLNADLLDGNDASAFMPAGADNWVDVTGDTMTGTLTTTDVDLGGSLLKSGQPFLHNNGTGTTAVGLGALSAAPPSFNNTAVGDQALSATTSGVNNTSAGYAALRYNVTGSDNTAFGAGALRNSTAGKKNTAFGKETLRNNTGDRNLALGYRAGYNLTTTSDNVFIAHEGTAGDSKVIRIGTEGTHFYTYMAGIANSTLSGDPVVIDAGGRLGVSPVGPVDADTLDGFDSEQFLRSDVSDTLNGAFVTVGSTTTLGIEGIFHAGAATSFALPATGIFGAGPGSGLNADKLDWFDSSDFMPAATDNWIDESGDTMTGLLTLDPASGLALQTGSGDDVDLGGNVLLDGTLFLHNSGTGNTAVGGDALSDNTTGSSNTAIGVAALDANTLGSANTAVGRYALQGNTDGGFNTAVGVSALSSNTTCCNTALGHSALLNNTSGTHNTAVGYSALRSTTGGIDNTSVGFHALLANSTGNRNTGTGAYALDSNSTGFGNTATGAGTLTDNTTGIYNTAIGMYALERTSTGGANTALGVKALLANTTGHSNVGIGYGAGLYVTAGVQNIFISNRGVAGDSATIRLGIQGTQTRTFIAGISGTTLSGDSVVVDASGQLGVSSGGGGGDADTLDGLDSTDFLRSNTGDGFTSGTLTTAAGTTLDVDGALDASGATSAALPSSGITGAGSGSGLDADRLDGNEASAFLTAATDNWVDETGDTMTGTLIINPGAGNALQTSADINLGGNIRKGGALFVHNNGTRNTAIGVSALINNTSGARNTAGGYRALHYNDAGERNTATGDRALYSNTWGSFNTAVGVGALFFNTTGQSNTAAGRYALLSNTTTSGSSAFGAYALRDSTGSRNTAVGQYSLRFNVSGYQNTAVGGDALLSNTAGVRNTAMGLAALRSTTGSNNVAMGFYAGSSATTGNANVFIANYGTASDSGIIRIGASGNQTSTFIAGIRGVTTGSADGVTVVIDSQGQLGTISSSRRYKEDVRDMGVASSRLMELRPVVFRYQQESASGEQPLRYGLIAEEVAGVFPELVAHDDQGRPETVFYHLLSAMLLNELQKQDRRLRDQERRLADQKRELDRLAAHLALLRGPP
ncbi:MAG: hypothetical protein GY856_50725 [bacterium]|nr:hypothetical protein [bacterium]